MPSSNICHKNDGKWSVFYSEQIGQASNPYVDKITFTKVNCVSLWHCITPTWVTYILCGDEHLIVAALFKEVCVTAVFILG